MVALDDVSHAPVEDQSGADVISQPSAPRRGRKAPALGAAQLAIGDIHAILHPKRRTGYGHKTHGLGPLVAQRLQEMSVFLQVYVHGVQCGEWINSSLAAAKILGRGSYYARQLRRWSVDFILSRSKLPDNRLFLGSIS